jgi:hypothetical protein
MHVDAWWLWIGPHRAWVQGEEHQSVLCVGEAEFDGRPCIALGSAGSAAGEAWRVAVDLSTELGCTVSSVVGLRCSGGAGWTLQSMNFAVRRVGVD